MRTSAMRLDKELVKGRFSGMDGRFLLLTLAVGAVYGLVIWSMTGIPVPEPTADDIRQLQNRFALLVLKEEPVPEQVPAVEKQETGKAVPQEERKKVTRERLQTRQNRSAEETRLARRQAALNRAEERRKAAAAVANVGAIALISALTDEGDEDEAVEDILASGGVRTRDLGKTLASLDGLKNAGTSAVDMHGRRQRRRQTGVTGRHGVEDLVAGIGTAASVSLSRKMQVDLAKPVLDRSGPDNSPTGSRSTDDINRVLRKKLGAIQYCYKRELRSNPGLTGKITVRFAITAAGRVRNVKVTGGTLRSATMERCLIKTVSMLRFKPLPAGAGVTKITYPFIFAG